MAVKDDKDLMTALAAITYKLEITNTEISKLRSDIASLPQSQHTLYFFTAANFFVNCLVLVVLYLNLTP